MKRERYSSSFIKMLEDLSKAVRVVNPKRACLFGSAVELGLDANDLDILVISDVFECHLFADRRDMIPFPKQKPIDVWPYTTEEFSALYTEHNPVRDSIESAHINLLDYD